jgi:RAQPRD family integrative conjugative element protein
VRRLKGALPNSLHHHVLIVVTERRNVRHMRSPATTVRHRAITVAALVVAFAAGLGASFATRAADSASERADLTAILRELNLLDRLADNAQAVAPEKSRYHFDYPRFRADITRVGAGIQDYLSPPRAQPRDPMALSGDYREGSRSP